MRLFSGIQPTGLLHIGNYFGAIKNWIALQEKHQSLFCVVDYHAITVSYPPKEMAKRIIDLTADYLACGLDPKKSVIFVQSTVPEYTELAWILNTITPLGDLKRMTQFKEKSKDNANVNAGLFNYPILMAADILLYQAEIVPVGEDQVQHLELTREIARKFNKTFGKTFVEPKPVLTSGARIMSLDDPRKKMSKSAGRDNYIALDDSLNTIWKKISTAVTDPARKRKTDPGNPQKCNLYSLHRLVSGDNDLNYVIDGCTRAKIGCLECKKLLAENLFKELKPIQERRKKIKDEEIKKILRAGALQAKEIATQTMHKVKKNMGLLF